jgi:hypothetical protein
MLNIFDLAKITKMVERHHPSYILIVDTNVLMNAPDLGTWKVSNKPILFVLSDGIIQELEFIRRRQESRDKAESREKADKAVKNLYCIFATGSIIEGIQTNTDWVISVPSPPQDKLEQELKQLEDIVKAFGRSDTKLLLLTKELNQSFENIPVILLTGEYNLFNIAQVNGIPCYLHTKFPIENLKECTERKGSELVDWDTILRETQNVVKEKSIEVEATLTSQGLAPQWEPLGNTSLIMAEGRGVIRDGETKRYFLWTIFYNPWNIISSDKSGVTFEPVSLDFLGEDSEQDIYNGIADNLLDCANISFGGSKPTLQNPKAVLEMITFLIENITREGVTDESAVTQLRQEISESENIVNYWLKLILNKEDDEQKWVYVLIQAINNCWKIGQIYKFRIMREKRDS